MNSTVRLYGPPKVGGDILSFCTKCRMELAHVIVSMVDGKASKVECKTCRGVHRYKLGTIATTSPRRPGTRVAAPKSVVRVAEVWQQKINDRPSAAILTYQPTQSFKQGELVQHPSFGVGIIEEVRLGNKIAVLFRDGEKVLIHGK